MKRILPPEAQPTSEEAYKTPTRRRLYPIHGRIEEHWVILGRLRCYSENPIQRVLFNKFVFVYVRLLPIGGI